MLSEDIRSQLKDYFAKLGDTIELRVASTSHEKQAEMLELLNGVASCSEKISVVVDGDAAVPTFEIFKSKNTIVELSSGPARVQNGK